jgi:ribulose-phosphate 3-epimerase
MDVVKKYAQKPLDVHLMIDKPERYIEDFKNHGADILTVHYEGAVHLHRTIEQIKSSGMMAGLAINPHTPVEHLSDIIPYLDVVLLMSVNPGFGGQKFIQETYLRLGRLRTLIDKLNPDCKVEIDGGVNMENAPKLLAKGADILVAGSFVFNSTNPKQTIAALKSL